MTSTNEDGNTDHYEGALLEEVRDNLKLLAEGMSGLKTTVDDISDRLAGVEQQTVLIPSIKAAITDQSRQLADHEDRIIGMEHATT